jgi:hypothetical protein
MFLKHQNIDSETYAQIKDNILHAQFVSGDPLIDENICKIIDTKERCFFPFLSETSLEFSCGVEFISLLLSIPLEFLPLGYKAL